jgi:TolB-like protein
MRNLIGITLVGLLLSGCVVKPKPGYTVTKGVVLDVRASEEMARASHDKPGFDEFGALAKEPVYQNDRARFSGQMLNKHIGDYVQNMAQDLINNMEYVTDKTPVGVTHFAVTDSDLNTTNILGYQIAESFIHELHKFRIPVLDFKATDYIRVTESGDFLLSRDFLELKHKVPMEYVLTGTMTKHQGGYLVNARILGLETKAVVASAQMLIPFYVAEALLPTNEQRVDGVRLIQGE